MKCVFKLLTLISLFLTFVCCGPGSGPVDPTSEIFNQQTIESCPAQNKPGVYCYFESETINNKVCTTKKQIFNNLQDYCRALTDETLNNNCAKSARNKKFTSDCSINALSYEYPNSY